MNNIFRAILIITISGLTACASKEETTRRVSEPDLEEASILNVQLALGYIDRGQLAVAKEKLDKAIEQNPSNIDAFTSMAYLSTKIGEYEEAENFYLDALDIKSNDPNIHNNYGGLLCQMGRYEEGLDEIKQAYENPFYESLYLAYANVGTCYIKMKDYAKAEKMLRKALRDQPNYASGLLSMAEIGVETNKYLMARAYIQRYHSLERASAESLWIQIRAEKALGAEDHYLKYARQLLNAYPDSDEAGLLDEMARNERIRK